VTAAADDREQAVLKSYTLSRAESSPNRSWESDTTLWPIHGVSFPWRESAGRVPGKGTLTPLIISLTSGPPIHEQGFKRRFPCCA